MAVRLASALALTLSFQLSFISSNHVLLQTVFVDGRRQTATSWSKQPPTSGNDSQQTTAPIGDRQNSQKSPLARQRLGTVRTST